MSKILQEKLINALATGNFVSGQELANELDVSRAAISNHINKLATMGLDIFRVRGKGYKLSEPLNLLNADKIQQLLKLRNINSLLEVHGTIDSTNNYLMRRLPNQISQGQICIAEYQSAGRGRRGRQWISPYGSHIYLSLYHQLHQGMSAAMGLSLSTALAIGDAIKKLYGIKVQLKWPNDVYLDGVKLAGILIDLEGQSSGPAHSVIGVGLNLMMPQKSAVAIKQPWTDLQSHIEEKIDRNVLVVEIISCLTERLNQLATSGLASMLLEWHQQDYFYNRPIILITGDRETSGICRGVNEQGALLIEVDGKIKAVYGGEVSVRGDL